MSIVASDRVGPNAAEVANSITHGFGFILSLIAAAVLMAAAWGISGWPFMALAIYAGTMVAVYAASTASHMFWEPRANQFFRMLDQGCIYLFIAGTFTPVAATFLRTGNWWILTASIWAIAILGFIG